MGIPFTPKRFTPKQARRARLKAWRYALIRWLALGDTVFINADIDHQGAIRSLNAGTLFFANLKICTWKKRSAIQIGGAGDPEASAGLWVEVYGTQRMYASACDFNGRNPALVVDIDRDWRSTLTARKAETPKGENDDA